MYDEEIVNFAPHFGVNEPVPSFTYVTSASVSAVRSPVIALTAAWCLSGSLL